MGLVTPSPWLGARISDVNVLAYPAASGGGVVSFLSPCVAAARARLPVDGHRARPAPTPRGTPRQTTSHHRDDRVVRRGVRRGVRRARILGVELRAAVARSPEHAHALSGAVMLAMALFLSARVPARAVAVPGEALPSAARTVRRRGTRVAGVAFGFGWSPCIGPILGRSSGSPRTRIASGRAARCSPCTHSGSAAVPRRAGFALGRSAARSVG